MEPKRHRLFSLSLAIGTVFLAGSASAQRYKTSILAKGLNTPTGIAVHSSGDLYFTELPDPGRFSQRNTVSLRDARTGNVTVIVPGEPGPTNIAVLEDRTFYWTCKSVGPIMRGKGTSHSTIARGTQPSGIAVMASGRVFVTQVPEPGKFNGRNNVAEIVNGQLKVLKMGEPEPVDVAVDANGNLYWTCKTAGVILRRDAKSSAVTFVLKGLDKPNGIALDAKGQLYFTEVPTPGMFGSQGGRNKVWKYDLAARKLTLIKFGDPEPTDVTASADGSSVYWTCSTAGVIMRADRMSAAPEIISASPARIGQRVDMTLSAPGQGGKGYVAATSIGLGPIPIDSRFLALAPDGVFFLSFGGLAPLFNGYAARLDATGKAKANIMLPNIPGLRGVPLTTAFLVLESTAPSGVAAISDTFYAEIE